MEIKKLKGIYDELVSRIESEPEKAASWIFPILKKLDFAECDVLVPFIIRYSENNTTLDRLSLERQMYLKEIINEIDNEHVGSGRAEIVLKLNPDISDVQIAQVFHQLKLKGVIQNKNEVIAEAVAALFSRNFNTIHSYFRDPSKMDKAEPIFNYKG